MKINRQTSLSTTIPLALCFGLLVFGTALAYSQEQSSSSQSEVSAIDNLPAQKVGVNEIDIAYRQFGNNSDRPIVLVAGAGATMDNMWSPTLLKELSSNRTVIIFDNRGVGQSSLGTSEFSITQFANDTAGLLDALGIQKADILGYSMGSVIAQELILKNPNRVDNLILAAAGCGGKEAIPPSPQVIPALAVMTTTSSLTLEQIDMITSTLFPPDWLKANPDFQDFIQKYLPLPGESVSPEIIKRQGEAIARYSQTGTCDVLSTVTHPTLAIIGTDDIWVPPGNALNIAERIPGAWLVQIRDAGHGLVSQYPDKFGKVITTFLQTFS